MGNTESQSGSSQMQEQPGAKRARRSRQQSQRGSEAKFLSDDQQQQNLQMFEYLDRFSENIHSYLQVHEEHVCSAEAPVN